MSSRSTAFRASAVPVTTHRMSATIRSRLLSILACPMPATKSRPLDISGLPVFTLKCTNVPDGDPLKNKVYKVTDPGRAMISGKCKDIGRFKGPILRGLAARAPFFHNGSAATLRDVVDFYDRRFGIGFTRKEKTDLVNFLNTL
jgi:cytochrome c peroxidase